MKTIPVRPELVEGRRFFWFILCLAVAGCATVGPAGGKMFDVTVEADFGPAGKPFVSRVVQVSSGATPRDATEKAFPVEKGAVCCDPREVSTIDGVAANPVTNQWWSVSVNGSKKGVSPYKTRLKPGDVVRWEYKQYGQ